jgi:hypothetical protein
VSSAARSRDFFVHDETKQTFLSLHTAVHRGSYRAQPVRRTYIPKTDGTEKPLGVASLEDKIVQHAVVTVLNAIYESDFVGISYGFRPGRSQHDALPDNAPEMVIDVGASLSALANQCSFWRKKTGQTLAECGPSQF